MSVSNFIHRQYQKWRYHTATDAFEKRAAEINRFEKVVVINDKTFQIVGHPYIFYREHHSFLLEQLDLLIVLLSRGELKVSGDSINYKIDGVNLLITSAEEIFIIHEIFFIGTYSVSATGIFKVIDIGLNVGMASLYFANMPQVSDVYAFEPVLPTYNQALKNFSLNPALAGKIRAFNYGLAREKGNAEVDFSYDRKAQVGSYGFSGSPGATRINITLQDAAEALRDIIAAKGTAKILMKIDCEGAEYGILQNLEGRALLPFIDILFIEWHQEGPEELLRILDAHQFTSFYQQAASRKVGMIYASR